MILMKKTILKKIVLKKQKERRNYTGDSVGANSPCLIDNTLLKSTKYGR